MGVIPSVWMGMWERLVSGIEAFINILSGTRMAQDTPAVGCLGLNAGLL